MAPLVEPKSLQKLSITAVSLAVDSACTDIFLEHGCYGNEVREATKRFCIIQFILLILCIWVHYIKTDLDPIFDNDIKDIYIYSMYMGIHWLFLV